MGLGCGSVVGFSLFSVLACVALESYFCANPLLSVLIQHSNYIPPRVQYLLSDRIDVSFILLLFPGVLGPWEKLVLHLDIVILIFMLLGLQPDVFRGPCGMW